MVEKVNDDGACTTGIPLKSPYRTNDRDLGLKNVETALTLPEIFNSGRALT